MAEIGTITCKIVPVFDEQALDDIAALVEQAVARGVQAGLAATATKKRPG